MGIKRMLWRNGRNGIGWIIDAAKNVSEEGSLTCLFLYDMYYDHGTAFNRLSSGRKTVLDLVSIRVV